MSVVPTARTASYFPLVHDAGEYGLLKHRQNERERHVFFGFPRKSAYYSRGMPWGSVNCLTRSI